MAMLEKVRDRIRPDESNDPLEVRTRLEDALAPYLASQLFNPPEVGVLDLRDSAPHGTAPRRRRSRPLRLVRHAAAAAG